MTLKYLLPKEYALLREMTGKRHGLLELNVVVRSPVHQIKHLVVQMLDFVVDIGFSVAFVIRRYVWQPHISLGVRGICAIHHSRSRGAG